LCCEGRSTVLQAEPSESEARLERFTMDIPRVGQNGFDERNCIVPMTRTSKESFIGSPWKLGMDKIVITEDFMRACDYALLVLGEEMPAAADPSKGWDSHSQMTGARRVLEILKDLPNPEKERKRTAEPTIYHA
jgi:hypothetical protein